MNPVLQKMALFFSVPKRTYSQKVVLLAFATFIVLVLKHKNYVPVNTQSASQMVSFVPRLLLTGWSDGLLLLGVSLFTLLALYASRKHRFLAKVFYGLFVFIVALLLFAAVVNPFVIQSMGRPLTYRWLYYSDFLNSTDAKNAVKANLNTHLLKSFVFTFGMMFFIYLVLSLLYPRIPKRILNAKRLAILLGASVLVYSIAFQYYKDTWKLSYLQLQNPVLYFVNSVFVSETPSLFTMEVPRHYHDEFLPSKISDTTNLNLSTDTLKTPIKNVVLFVLESVAAKYVDLYGGKYGVTPNLNQLADESILYNNVYAHTPTTPFAMVSLLSSTYPILSYRGITAEHPNIPIPTLSSELKKHDYRTAFFNAGDIRFQKCDQFLKAQKFDVVQDYRDGSCKDQQFIVEGDRWEHPDGADDQCIVRSFEQWVPKDGKVPFFATLWTVQTHYPYVVSGQEKDYCAKENENLNKYLNALHHADEALGDLVTTLKKYGLDKSTLIVVVGDHGEAFGEHEQVGHGSEVYEENLRVPLLFINPSLFGGERSDRLVGQIDIAPSIMDVLQLPSPASWQGESLFRQENPSKKVYFFCPWSNDLFGYRDRDYKYIFNASSNTDQVYDLNKDPEELTNLADKIPNKMLQDKRLRLAAWTQYQNDYFKRWVGMEKELK